MLLCVSQRDYNPGWIKPSVRISEGKNIPLPHLFLNALTHHRYACAKCSLLERQHGKPIKMLNVNATL